MLSLMWKPGRHVHIYKTAQHRDNKTIKKDAFVWGICVTLPTAGLKLPLAHLFGLRSCKRLLHLRGPLLYPPLYKPSEKHHKTDKTGCIQSVPHVSSAGPEGSYMHTHAHIWPRGEKKEEDLKSRGRPGGNSCRIAVQATVTPAPSSILIPDWWGKSYP